MGLSLSTSTTVDAVLPSELTLPVATRMASGSLAVTYHECLFLGREQLAGRRERHVRAGNQRRSSSARPRASIVTLERRGRPGERV